MRLTMILFVSAVGLAGVLLLGPADLPAAPPAESAIRAGVAVVDITPPPGWRMSGYFNERLNTATHDPLQAKALVLAQGDTKAALVFCDLIGMSLDVSRRARERASGETGIPVSNIAIAATHSHTGPLYFGELRKYFHEKAVAEQGSDPHEPVDYSAVLAEKLVEAIRRADANTREAQLAAGVVAQSPQLSFNRRFHMKDGTVQFNPGQQNPNIVRVAGPIDPDVGVLLVRAAGQGQPAAALAVFAMHLDTVGGTEYSADYPYYLERTLRGQLGDDFMSLFGTGTCGDINHIDVATKGRRPTDEMGRLLGETVLGAIPKLRPVEPASLAVKSATVPAKLQQYSASEVAEASRNMAKIGTRELSFLEQVKAAKIMDVQLRQGPTLPLEVQAFRVGSDLAIVTLPGEVFVELGMAIKRASPFRTTLVIELTNDTPAYIPTTKAFGEGSYETVNSRIQPGGGEEMAATATRLLKELAE